MRTLVVLFALVSLVAIGCNSADEPMAPTSGGKSGQVQGAESSWDLPVSWGDWNPCCEEWIQVSGTAHVVWRKNGYHINVSNMSGSGYTQVGSAIENSTGQENGGKHMLRLRLRNDDGCEYSVVIHIKVQYNANGELTALIEKWEFECDNP